MRTGIAGTDHLEIAVYGGPERKCKNHDEDSASWVLYNMSKHCGISAECMSASPSLFTGVLVSAYAFQHAECPSGVQ